MRSMTEGARQRRVHRLPIDQDGMAPSEVHARREALNFLNFTWPLLQRRRCTTP
jgi:hypothetical protein